MQGVVRKNSIQREWIFKAFIYHYSLTHFYYSFYCGVRNLSALSKKQYIQRPMVNHQNIAFNSTILSTLAFLSVPSSSAITSGDIVHLHERKTFCLLRIFSLWPSQ